MAETLSEDLRGRVVAAIEAGTSRRGAAERFGVGVGVATAIRWMRQFWAIGSVVALPKGDDLRSHHIEAFRAVILVAIGAKGGITLVELAAPLKREQGVSFAPRMVNRFLVRYRITLKKRRAYCRAGRAQRGL